MSESVKKSFRLAEILKALNIIEKATGNIKYRVLI